MKCKCGSYAINPHLYGRDKTDLDLCDVCYWRKRANSTQQLKAEICAFVVDLSKSKSMDETDSIAGKYYDKWRKHTAV